MTESPDPPADAAPPAAAPAPAPAAGAAAPPSPTPEDWESRFKYLLADFENFRRRTARQQDQARERARAELLRRLLPIIEAVEHARTAIAPLPVRDPVRHGLELLSKEWTSFLDAEGVQPVAQPGVPFDPDDHEAVGEAPVTAAHPVGTVVEVVQQGYRFAGGLLRPAKVVVARASTGTAPPATLEEPPPADPTN